MKHRTLIASAVSALLASHVYGETFSWIGPVSGSFSDATCWNPNSGPPGPTDSAVFDVGTALIPFTVSFDGETTVEQARIGLATPAWALVGNQFVITGNSAGGINNCFIVGARPTDVADLTVQGGTLLSMGGLIIGDQYDGGNSASGSMRITGGEADPGRFIQGDDSVYSSDFRIGGSGNGMLNIDGYGSVLVREHAVNAEGARSSAWVVLGEQASGKGIMNVTGPNASFDLEHAPMVVGDQGSGEIYVTKGARVSIADGEMWLAMRSGATAIVQIRDPGSSLSERSDYTSVVGNGGSGTLLVADSGYADIAHLRIGGEDAATNHAGSGTMEVATWGIVECDEAAVGPSRHNGLFSTGIVRIVSNTDQEGGGNATWNIRNSLALGGTESLRGGKGTLAVEGTDGYVRVGIGDTNAAMGGSLILWGDGGDVDDDGMLDVHDGRVVVGSDVFAEPGTLRIAEPGILDMRGGVAQLRRTSETGTIELGRVDLEGQMLGHGTIDGHIWISGGTLTNDTGQALNITGQMMVGFNNASGLVNVTGENSLIHVTGRANESNVVGVELGSNDGTGILNIAGGGHLKIDWALVVGGNSIGAGTLNLQGADSRLTVGHDITVGREAVGTLEISDGGQLEQLPLNNPAGMMTIGANAAGTAIVSGGDTNVSVLRLDIGNMASGAMTIEQGANVDSAGQLLMGRNGAAASLIIQNNGWLTTGYGTSPTQSSGLVGSGAPFPDPGLSEVTIDDATWVQDGVVTVAFRDGTRGRINVRNWGLLQSAHGVIARVPGADGEVNVSDEYTNWNCGTGDIGVGGLPAGANIGGTNPGVDVAGGTGRLSITDSGQVSAGRIKVFPQGALTLGEGTANAHVEVDGLIAGRGNINGSLIISDAGTMRSQFTSGSDFDALFIDGHAAVDGTLQAVMVGGYVPPQGATFTVLSASGVLTGTFASIEGREIDPTHWLLPLYDSTSVQLAVALAGDANLDGLVDSTDFNLLVGHYAMTSQTWLTADFTGEGKVDTMDFNLLSGNFGTSPGAGPSLGSTIPEPSTGAAIGFAVMTLLRRRRA
jgi:T5SS/PEP-CTERM-associated repeat protein